MRVLVTGAAGFIGSRSASLLLADGHEVIAMDNLDPYYSPEVKRVRMDELSAAGAKAVEADLLGPDLLPAIESVDAVLHLAGQAGVRKSWDAFDSYVRSNVLVTHRILEAVQKLGTPPRLVLASSSSVYGEQHRYPTSLGSPTNPKSPYGVTKLAAEHLGTAYAKNFGIPTVSLRYFTVYGPGQRPDMAFHRLCEAALGRAEFTLMGDGSQVRDFTYVDDVCRANILALKASLPPGTILNVGGGAPVSMHEVLEFFRARAPGIVVNQAPAAAGDVLRTGADISKTVAALGWEPVTDWRSGLEAQLESARLRGE